MKQPCENCEVAEGKVQYCEADGRLHHHGMVHVLDGGLQWLCDFCVDIDRKAWKRRKRQLAQARQVIDI